MKTVSYHISIPKPCHEDWEKMLPEARGRFCMACQKSVTDFSKMSDEGIIDYLKSHQNLCGRFGASQLNRSISAQIYQPRTTPWWQAVLFAAFALFANRAIALPHYKTVQTTQQLYIAKPQPKAFEMYGPDRDTTSQTIELKGTVMDSTTKESLVGALIIVYQNGERIARAITDADGNFDLKVKEKGGDSMVIVCHYLGYKDFREPQINRSDLNMSILMSEGNIGNTTIVSGCMTIKRIDNNIDAWHNYNLNVMH